MNITKIKKLFRKKCFTICEYKLVPLHESHEYKEKYVVKRGESLESIVERMQKGEGEFSNIANESKKLDEGRYDSAWECFAEFNYGSTEPSVVNWMMCETHGFDKNSNITGDQKNYKYKGGEILYYPSKFRKAKTGQKHSYVEVVKDIIVIDSHMHVMSGHCTPLPLVWDKTPLPIKPKRKTIDGLDRITDMWLFQRLEVTRGLGEMTKVQRKSTWEIGIEAVSRNHIFYYNEIYRGVALDGLYTPMIVMPMDMEYAHINGYNGEPIYKKVDYREYLTMYSVSIDELRELRGKEGRGQEKIIVAIKGSKYYASLVDFPELKHKERRVAKQLIIWPDDVHRDSNGNYHTRNDLPTRATLPAKYIAKTRKEKKDYYYYFIRRSADDKENVKKRDPMWLDVGEHSSFKNWDTQRLDTITLAVNFPFRLIPMYHYEPRRWSLDKGATPGSEHNYNYPQAWDAPFTDIATKSNHGVFIGFKMYTALGYQPLDPKLKNIEKFYKRCANDSIPVLCHCSPGGMYTFERKFYLHSYLSNPNNDPAVSDKYVHWYGDDKVDYFNDHFVNPGAWRDVLRKHGDLKLCLAHFGGADNEWKQWNKWYNSSEISISWELGREWLKSKNGKAWASKTIGSWYENDKKCIWIKEIVNMIENYDHFYTDISCHMLQKHKKVFAWLLQEKEHITDRILFGTDWYMTEMGGYGYERYCREAKKVLDEISDKIGSGENLWIKFSRTNPLKFYGLKAVAENMAEGLKKEAIRRVMWDSVEDEIGHWLDIVNNSHHY